MCTLLNDFNGKVSETRGIKCGVPQGSINGPLLFMLSLIVFPMLFVIVYADNTCVLKSSNHNQIILLQCKIQRNFFKQFANNLSLNSIFIMIFHCSRKDQMLPVLIKWLYNIMN